MKVNANVTFVIWILEWIANVSIYICWILGPNFARYFPEVILIWYYIILPHTFLMNTSHNKDLIIDDGLKTTLINAFGLPFNLNRGDRSTKMNSQNNVAEKDAYETKMSPNAKKNVNDDASNDAVKIFTISTIDSPSIEMKNFKICQPNITKRVPSTSTGKSESLEKSHQYLISQKIISDSDIDLDSLSDFQDPAQNICKEILSQMKKYLDDATPAVAKIYSPRDGLKNLGKVGNS